MVVVILPSSHCYIALDDRIDELAELIRDHYNIPDLGDPASSTEVGSSSSPFKLSASSSIMFRTTSSLSEESLLTQTYLLAQ
jgi:DNA polymerase alpha subunit B